MELKPCPFCGGKPEVRCIGNLHCKKIAVHISCSTFGCTIEMRCAGLVKNGGTHEQCEKWATEKWNHRVQTRKAVNHVPMRKLRRTR